MKTDPMKTRAPAHCQATPGRDPRSSDPLSSQRGFTLVETMVGLAVTAEVLLVSLLLFDINSRIARNQVQVADMQQSQRIAHNDMARMVRMAGRGGLSQDVAVVVTDDADPTTVDINGNEPVEGTDILTIRGVISSPMFQIRQSTANYTPPTGPQYDNGQIVIEGVTPTGITQALDAFDDVVSESQFGGRETDALILVSATSDSVFAVVEVTNISFTNNTDVDGDGTDDRVATITFSADTSGNVLSKELDDLNSPTPGVFPAALEQTGAVGYAGLVEEYRFYIRDVTTADGGYSPKLSRARFYPNTDRVYGEAANSTVEGVANGKVDIADNVMDLQVALGIDADGDGVIEEATDQATDEWLFNHANDQPGDFDATDLLYNVQLTTLVRTDRMDRNYMSEPLTRVANNVYNEPATPQTARQTRDRSHRRQLLTTIVDLRNVN